ncbi:MAG TPA: (2Fe-2S)-binding protein [Rhodanobacter sp.]|nr:(2Fe-2S)-binding protein [Rhodanobacter sp.]
MSGERVSVQVNGIAVQIVSGSSVAAAIAWLGMPSRRSVSGQWRAPLCGMGVCFECRVCIDGVAQQRACMVPVREGMQVRTDD